ncbi:alpha-L-rhamnosidase [Actinacidiphila yanglinensis]|uniref:alpha-L-rhamnosidase n=1 Tax=Actinacidiphila yanglinensis TaxID=310779 RepID=A0A1H6DE29_9ACTN|nr:family 78 glycoside hydrolase catalytic domain [Actinacidiphila yanglinensis]SEG83471.1 alpha-L-rhamnosidase [Actinacidiphila yanglinensis]
MAQSRSAGHRRTVLLAALTAWLTAAGVVLGVAAPSAVAAPHPDSGRGSAGAAPHGLTVGGLTAPVDVDPNSTPLLGWKVGAGRQSGYEIEVAATAADLARGHDVWDSGRIASAASGDIAYGGPALGAAAGYAWRVRTWDARTASAWSAAASFGTGPGTAWPGATPVWAADPAPWTDYTFQGSFVIDAKYASVTFRESDTSDFYLWQFKGNGENTIAPQVQKKGTFSNLKPAEPLPFALADGTAYDFRIVADGSTFTTYLKPAADTGWTLVDTTTDATFASGGIGFRTGSTEQATFDDITVTGPDGTQLYANDFSDPAGTDFSCGTVTGQALFIDRSKNCGTGFGSADWAFLRGDVTLPAGRHIAWAHLYATGSSTAPTRQFVYKMWVNGRFVGVGPTRPLGAETRYDGYDVTSLLRPGAANTLGALAYTTSDRRFLADLVVRFTDGTTRTFGTGAGWKAENGAAVLPSAGSIGTSYYTAPVEDFDSRAYPTGFAAPGFDDSSWSAPALKGAFTDLEPTPTAKVGQRRETPASVVEYAPGDYYVDYGRSWIGGLSLDLTGSAGQVLDIRYGQVPSGTDTVRYQTSAGNTYEDRWTLRSGTQHLETWGLRVFRYVQITGAPTGLTAKDLTAEAYVYPFDTSAGTFDSSDSALDQVWALSRNTVEMSNQNLYVDSWERERGVYEADSYLQLMANLYTGGDATLGDYSLNFLLSTRTWPTEWPMYLVLAMHDSYEATGDTTALAADYTALQGKLPDRWFDPASGLIHKTTGDTGASSCTDCDIVDWPASERDGYVFSSYNTVINAISYRAYEDMADIATALGRTADAAADTAKATAIRSAVNATMWDPAKGAYRDGLDNSGAPIDHYAVQASVFATAFGLADDQQAAQVASYLGTRGMACSVYCAAFMIQALYDGNRPDLAHSMLTSTGTDSWLNMIKAGAGATMEAWDLSLKSNTTYSHPWAASPAFDIPQDMFGIRPTTAGYATFDIRPRPAAVGWAHVTVPTGKGEIGAAFDTVGSRVDVGVEIPPNTRADVYLPGGSATDTTVYVDGRRVTATYDNGSLRVDGMAPGCHVLSTDRGHSAAQDARLTGICSQG